MTLIQRSFVLRRIAGIAALAGAVLLGGCSLIGGKKDKPDVASHSEAELQRGVGVNGFLWRAALDTLSFMPITQSDGAGGVIVTDWYSNPDQPGERFKLNVFIKDRALRADALQVIVFRQIRSGDGWSDAPAKADTSLKLEDAILDRARFLRISSGGK